MALVRTTLASAYTAGDKQIVVASATGFAAGYQVRIDQEVFLVAGNYQSGTTIPVVCGQQGTVNAAHASGAGVVAGTASDWSSPAAQTAVQYPIAGRARTLTSYSASGAITLPAPGSDAVAIINGTSALDMTIAAPTKDMDGCILYVAGNGNAAHTFTYAGGFGGAGTSYDKLTSAASPFLIIALAANEKWMFPIAAAITGTVTNITAGIG